MAKLLLLISAWSNRNNLNSIDNIADQNGPKEDLKPKASLIARCSQPDSQDENESRDHDRLFIGAKGQNGCYAGQRKPTPLVSGLSPLIARPSGGWIHRSRLILWQTRCSKSLESNVARQRNQSKYGHRSGGPTWQPKHSVSGHLGLNIVESPPHIEPTDRNNDGGPSKLPFRNHPTNDQHQDYPWNRCNNVGPPSTKEPVTQCPTNKEPASSYCNRHRAFNFDEKPVECQGCKTTNEGVGETEPAAGTRVHSIIELEEKGRNRAVEVIFERPVMGKPMPGVIGCVKLGDQDAGVGVLKEQWVLSMQNQDRKAR